ncbi:ribokinase [Brevibacillus panacihumi W25]|uniref:Ribokinase n=1 Tax=Brevibacillus panacihumi W25 TaxID=1408254 RepID=V6M3Y4_9BACL|nr:ribokinase [Brevibacillus panacihumi]EST53299.1 ribokinase [Brevibacillus panacihumi W25]
MNRSPHIVVIGSLNMDIVVEANRPPALGETVMGEQIHFIPGGKGANQAVALARLGAKTAMIGTVGNDSFGEDLLRAMNREGIDVAGVKTVQDGHTGVASIVLAEGDNQIIVVPGANAACLPMDLEAQTAKIAAADAVLLQLEIPLETVLHAAKTAKSLGKTVVLNPAPARPLPDELLQHVDVLIPNESELLILAEEKGQGLEAAMRSLQKKGVRIVVTTLGAKGAAFLTEEESGVVPSHQVPVVDTTGAGDSFNAGFSYALASGKSVRDAVAFATKVAALAVTRLGAQAGMPTLAQVEQFHQ